MTLAEQFREEGMMEGLEKGELKALVKATIKLLTKKFGALSEEFKTETLKLDTLTLEIIIGDILEYQSLEDAENTSSNFPERRISSLRNHYKVFEERLTKELVLYIIIITELTTPLNNADQGETFFYLWRFL